jgi:hypothetical protein
MSEDTLGIDVCFSERERFTLAIFFTSTFKPKTKAERKALKLAFRRFKLDEIIARCRKPGGIKIELLSDAPVVVSLTQEAIDWAMAHLNTVQSETADSLILADVEERLDEVVAGTYVVPPNATRPKVSLASVPAAPAEAPPAS